MDRIKRQRRQHRIRARLRGTAERPRISVYRSNHYVWVQLIDDEAGRTLAAVHGKQFAGVPKLEQAKRVGIALAAVARAAGVTAVVFDRSGYLYHGRVKAVADSLRQGGLSV
jgi:large subunit ribosomal protein L18